MVTIYEKTNKRNNQKEYIIASSMIQLLNHTHQEIEDALHPLTDKQIQNTMVTTYAKERTLHIMSHYMRYGIGGVRDEKHTNDSVIVTLTDTKNNELVRITFNEAVLPDNTQHMLQLAPNDRIIVQVDGQSHVVTLPHIKEDIKQSLHAWNAKKQPLSIHATAQTVNPNEPMLQLPITEEHIHTVLTPYWNEATHHAIADYLQVKQETPHDADALFNQRRKSVETILNHTNVVDENGGEDAYVLVQNCGQLEYALEKLDVPIADQWHTFASIPDENHTQHYTADDTIDILAFAIQYGYVDLYDGDTFITMDNPKEAVTLMDNDTQEVHIYRRNGQLCMTTLTPQHAHTLHIKATQEAAIKQLLQP